MLLLEIQHQAADHVDHLPHHASALIPADIAEFLQQFMVNAKSNMRFLLILSSPFKVHKNII
nr:MAG TPA: hypothetical protein [Caudoviricetes sp.]